MIVLFQLPMTANYYFDLIVSTLEQQRNPTRAVQQSAYLRNKFTFYGWSKPDLNAAFKAINQQHPLRQVKDSSRLIKRLIDAEYRELHYGALFIAEKNLKKRPPDFISILEQLVTTHSWWDTVDHVAKLVGIHFQRYPKLIIPTTERWMESENIWLQRVCIIFQLFYRTQTDWALLQRYILAVSDSEEFFLQKAAGWALRQYSRTAPQRVVAFVQDYELPKLTQREALRLLK